MTSDAPRGSWDGMRVLVLSPVPTWPVTLGNRNRIVQVNRALQREGARVGLLHYPSDEEWRARLPRAAMARMDAQWEEVFHAPVTRPLHPRPTDGPDHAIDEWWDPAIGEMLDWLFKVGRYDALVVNYTWLSKALDHAPAGVLRILDTHDRFSGRREMLAAHGLRAEYFHTTEDQERIALDRADVVWAIKDQEAAFFRGLTARPVRTLLHMEPTTQAATPREPDGVLRLGIVGGRNNINAINIRRFLVAADAYLRRTLLPVEIVVGGSVCTLLEGLRMPFLRQIGAVESMDELYDQVDVVLAPLAFSTGLKIKVGEALARGAPLVSHAHAFEGYVPTHPFHDCADFDAMLRAVHRLVREPALLGELAAASAGSVAAARTGITQVIADAGAQASALPPSMIVALRFDQMRADALIFDHILDVARYAGFRVPVALHFRGDPALADPAALRLLALRGRAVVDPACPALPDAVAEALFDDSRPRRASLESLLAAPHLAAWFAALPDAAPAAGLVRTRLGIAHAGALALDGGDVAPDGAMHDRLVALAAAFPRFLLAEEAPSREAAAMAHAAGIARVAAPLLWRGEDSRLLAALRGAQPGGPVALLAGDIAEPALVPVLAFLTTALGRDVVVFAPDAPAPDWPKDGPLAVRRAAVSLARPADAFDPLRWQRRRPAFIVEHGRTAAARPAREVALRAGIAHLRIGDAMAPDVASAAPGLCYRARGFVSAAVVMAALDRRGDPQGVADAAEELGKDAGWARIWGELGQVLAA